MYAYHSDFPTDLLIISPPRSPLQQRDASEFSGAIQGSSSRSQSFMFDGRVQSTNIPPRAARLTAQPFPLEGMPIWGFGLVEWWLLFFTLTALFFLQVNTSSALPFLSCTWRCCWSHLPAVFLADPYRFSIVIAILWIRWWVLAPRSPSCLGNCCGLLHRNFRPSPDHNYRTWSVH